MSRHKLFVANGQYPRFSGSPAFGPRVDALAGMIEDSGADCATLGEMGYRECAALADHPKMQGWQYDRSQGKGRYPTIGEGLNSTWSKISVWNQPEDRLNDWNLGSYGQWQRTLVLPRLEEKRDPTAFVQLGAFHFAATGAPLNRAQANVAKLAQIKQSIKLCGDRRVILAGDFPRTDDDDDVVLLRRNGYTIVDRVQSTPMVAIYRGAITFYKSSVVRHGRAFDHDARVYDWSVLGDKEKA